MIGLGPGLRRDDDVGVSVLLPALRLCGCAVAVAVAVAVAFAVAVEQPDKSLAPKGAAHGCAAGGAGPWMANRERALSATGRRIGLDSEGPFFLVTCFFGSAKKK